jgi:hypothetical protein
MVSEIPDIPRNMQRVYERFQQWRSAHTGVRVPIPEGLWRAAVEVAREHGVCRTSKVLRLEYGKLKGLVEAGSGRSNHGRRPSVARHRARSMAPPAFVELLAPRPSSGSECRVELEGPRGRMRIEFKGIATAELGALGRALWDGEAWHDQGER